ncbi:MAG TPA: SBBP repeat-containing protein [Bacteroidia bacterium]|jgi:hypothetical protein|nr:SBBP repeat-containing protein [Bacteroidia bacterium]
MPHYYHSFGMTYPDHSVAVDKAGNSYIAGSFGGILSFGADTVKATSNFGIYLVKYDASGNVLWARQANEDGSVNNGGGASVALDRTGNAYITGYFESAIYFGTDTLKATHGWDMFTAKYNANGNVLWAKQATNTNYPSNSYGSSIAVDGSSNAYITGWFAGIIAFGSDTLKETGGYENVLVAKYDSSGNFLWARQCSTPNTSYNYAESNSIAVDKSGNSYITGYGGDTLYFGPDTLVSNGIGSFFLVKYSANGNVIWAKQAIGNASGYSAAINGSGGIYITGYFTGAIYFDTDTLKETAVNGDAFIAKYNSNGNLIWAKQVYILDSNSWFGCSATCDTLTNGGGYFLTSLNGGGNSPYKLKFGADTFSLNTPIVSTGASLLLQLDSTGNVLCGTMFNGSNNSACYLESIGVDKSGHYIYLDGDLDTTLVFGIDTLVTEGTECLPFLASWGPCVDTNITTSLSPISNSHSLSLFPNPNTGAFTLRVVSGLGLVDSKMQVEVYNVLGERVFKETLRSAQGDNLIDISSNPGGVYLYRVMDESGALVGEGKFVIEK